MVWLPAPSAGAGTAFTVQAVATRLQAAADDVVRRGALGTVIAVEIPGVGRSYAASGYVDLERKIPMDTGRGFQIGSITKTFTSAAILLLEKEGKIDFDEKLSKYVQGYMGSPDVTIRHLLTHSSGIGDGQI